jgi:hypothetical protein
MTDNPYTNMAPEKLDQDNNYPIKLASSAWDKGYEAAVADVLSLLRDPNGVRIWGSPTIHRDAWIRGIDDSVDFLERRLLPETRNE